MRLRPDFIHEFVPGSSSRTLLLLHGTGGNERDLIPLGRELRASIDFFEHQHDKS